MNDKQHQEDAKYKQWADGMYVMLDDLDGDYELALVENSLRDSVYFGDERAFSRGKTEDSFGVYGGESGCWWADAMYLELTRAQAIYIATGDTDM